MATCRNGHEKTAENAYLYKPKNRSRTYAYCRICRDELRIGRREQMKDYMLDRRYRLTRKERSDLLVEQDGLCGICYERPAITVDHDHKTGRVRGMLCKGCNTALGVFGDSVEALQGAIDYLTSARASEVV